MFPWTEEQHVPDLIDAAVSHLEGRREALRAFTAAPGVTAELYVSYLSGNGQGGFVLPPALLARIANAGFGLCLNFFLPESEEFDD